MSCPPGRTQSRPPACPACTSTTFVMPGTSYQSGAGHRDLMARMGSLQRACRPRNGCRLRQPAPHGRRGVLAHYGGAGGSAEGLHTICIVPTPHLRAAAMELDLGLPGWPAGQVKEYSIARFGQTGGICVDEGRPVTGHHGTPARRSARPRQHGDPAEPAGPHGRWPFRRLQNRRLRARLSQLR